MLKSLSPLVLALAAAAMAQGQSTYVFAPDNGGVNQPSSSAAGWRDSATGFRTQLIYDSTHFDTYGVTGPVTITRLRFRAANSSTSVGGQYPGDGVSTGIVLDIGTSAVDHAAASATFAANRGTMQNVLTWATVNVGSGIGQIPNAYVIDIPIPGGFVYDPTLGQDLLIDITGSDFLGTMPPLASSSTVAPTRCQRVGNAPSTATTGTFSASCPVVLFDITGPGGIPDNGSGFPLLSVGSAVNYGTSCGPDSTRAFAELFPGGTNSTLDLGTGITLTPNVPGAPTAYLVSAGSAALVPATGTPLLNNAASQGALTDDSMSQACTLPFPFPFVGGTTSVVHLNTNGYVVLGATSATGGDFSPTLGEMVTSGTSAHSGLPRLFPCWFDFNPVRNQPLNPAAGLYYQVDATSGNPVLTWLDMGETATTTAGTKSFNLQVELFPDGSIQFRYGAMSPFGSATAVKIVGFSPGSPGQAPTSVDLSATMPYLTGTIDQAPMSSSSTQPLVGAPYTLTTVRIPAPGVLFQWLSFTQFNPGVDLASVGAPGCSKFAENSGAPFSVLTVGGSTQTLTLQVPRITGLIGAQVFAQAAALAPGYNPLGIQTSNGITLTVGTVR